MSKLNISFQGKQYGIEKSVLDGAISNIQSQLFKLSAGSVEETLEGDGAEYYTLAPSTLSFRSTAPLDELQEVQVNGRTVDPSNYTLEEGSTVVTFNIDYLKQLNDGDYEVAVLSEKQSSKGGFTVASPKVSQYGFYYNQPYNGYVDAFGDYIVFFFRENGTVDVVFLYGGMTMNCTYTADIGSFVITDPDGMQYNGMVVDENPMELYCFELGNTFTLGNGVVFSDDDYLYVYTEEYGTYLPAVFDKTKRQYKPVKSNINGIDITSLSGTYQYCENLIVTPQIPSTVRDIHYAFFGCTSLVSAVVQTTVLDTLYTFCDCTALKSVIFECKNLGDSTFAGCYSLTNVSVSNNLKEIQATVFNNCTSLKSIELPNSIKSISYLAFSGCESLKSIKYNGTKSQWRSINKSGQWNVGMPTDCVIYCTDGNLDINDNDIN